MSKTITMTAGLAMDTSSMDKALYDVENTEQKKLDENDGTRLGYKTKADLRFFSEYELKQILEEDDLSPFQQEEVNNELKLRKDTHNEQFAVFHDPSSGIKDVENVKREILNKSKFAEIMQRSDESVQSELSLIGVDFKKVVNSTPGIEYTPAAIHARNTARANADAVIHNMKRNLKARVSKRKRDIALQPNDVLITTLRANAAEIKKKNKKVSIRTHMPEYAGLRIQMRSRSHMFELLASSSRKPNTDINKFIELEHTIQSFPDDVLQKINPFFVAQQELLEARLLEITADRSHEISQEVYETRHLSIGSTFFLDGRLQVITGIKGTHHYQRKPCFRIDVGCAWIYIMGVCGDTRERTIVLNKGPYKRGKRKHVKNEYSFLYENK